MAQESSVAHAAEALHLTQPALSRQPIDKTFSQNAFVDWFGDSYDKLNVVGTYNLPYTATMLAARGFGSVVLLEGTAMARDPELVFIPMEPRLEVYSEIAWKRHRMLSPAAAAFLETLEEVNIPRHSRGL